MLCWYALTFKFSRSGHRRDGRFCPQIGGKNRRQLIYFFHPEMRRWSLQGLPQQVNMFSRERPHSRFKGSWEDDLPVKICSFPGGYRLIKSRLFLFHIKMHLQLLYYCEGLPSVFLDIVRYSFGGQPSSFAALLDIEWLRSLATLTTGFWTFLNAPPPKKNATCFTSIQRNIDHPTKKREVVCPSSKRLTSSLITSKSCFLKQLFRRLEKSRVRDFPDVFWRVLVPKKSSNLSRAVGRPFCWNPWLQATPGWPAMNVQRVHHFGSKNETKKGKIYLVMICNS